jgi:hypothetical protein
VKKKRLGGGDLAIVRENVVTKVLGVLTDVSVDLVDWAVFFPPFG